MLKLPTRYVPIGEKFKIGNKVYVAEEVKGLAGMQPLECCNGCVFYGDGRVTCGNLQCSKFDRVDKTDVWFKLLEILEDETPETTA